jgi:hypothetical protein
MAKKAVTLREDLIKIIGGALPPTSSLHPLFSTTRPWLAPNTTDYGEKDLALREYLSKIMGGF